MLLLVLFVVSIYIKKTLYETIPIYFVKYERGFCCRPNPNILKITYIVKSSYHSCISMVHFWFGPWWGVYVPGVTPSDWVHPRSMAFPSLKSMILLCSSRATTLPFNSQFTPNPATRATLVSLLRIWFPKSVAYL